MTTLSEDRDEIRDLYGRYCFHVDTGTPEQWADLFTTDGEFTGPVAPVTGTEALTEFATEVLAGGGGMHHMVSNVALDVNGDDAVGTASVAIFIAGALGIVGRYQDELRKVDGRWKFSRRNFLPDAPPAQ
jgi:uncharacterized protein (TIGR02246 family)